MTTPSTVSEVSICNQSLTWLGQKPITSFTDGNTTAEWMRNNYPFLRDAVLEERMWTFATARAVSESQDQPVWGSGYVHPFPLDWLVVKRVFSQVESNDPNQWIPAVGWRLEGTSIITRESITYLQGIKRVTDTGQFSHLFVQALAARIAADAAIPLTENRQLQADMWNLARSKLIDAAAIDGGQGRSDILVSNSLIKVRR